MSHTHHAFVQTYQGYTLLFCTDRLIPSMMKKREVNLQDFVTISYDAQCLCGYAMSDTKINCVYAYILYMSREVRFINAMSDAYLCTGNERMPARSLFLTLLQCTTSTAIKGLLVVARLRVQPDSGSAALSSSDRTGITATQHHFQSPSWRPGQGQHERGRRPPRAAEPEIVRVGGYGAWFRPGGQ
jgi:hypothetical protein